MELDFSFSSRRSLLPSRLLDSGFQISGLQLHFRTFNVLYQSQRFTHSSSTTDTQERQEEERKKAGEKGKREREGGKGERREKGTRSSQHSQLWFPSVLLGSSFRLKTKAVPSPPCFPNECLPHWSREHRVTPRGVSILSIASRSDNLAQSQHQPTAHTNPCRKHALQPRGRQSSATNFVCPPTATLLLYS